MDPISCHPFVFHHCNSCHEDNDNCGYDLQSFDLNGTSYYGCCSFEDYLKNESASN